MVLLQLAGDGDGIADFNDVGAVAREAVAHDGFVGHVVHHDGNGHIFVLSAVRGVNFGDDAGQREGAVQESAGGKVVNGVDDLRGSLVFVRVVGLRLAAGVNAHQLAVLVELAGIVVALQRTGDGDGVADFKRFHAVALHAVAHNGLVGEVAYHDGDGNVFVLRVVRGVEDGDHAGEGVCAFQRLAFFKLIQCVQDLRDGLVGFVLGDRGLCYRRFGDRRLVVVNAQQLAAGVKFERIVEALEVARNGDAVAFLQRLRAGAREAVALDRFIRHIAHLDRNGDVAELLVPRGIHFGDHA